MKDEQIKLSQEAQDCANLFPDLNKMFSAVQELGKQIIFFSFKLILGLLFSNVCISVSQSEDLKLKYSEEQAERKKLYNQIQETKGIPLLDAHRIFC